MANDVLLVAADDALLLDEVRVVEEDLVVAIVLRNGFGWASQVEARTQEDGGASIYTH